MNRTAGCFLIVASGVVAYIISSIYPALNPLFIALIFGIAFGSILESREIKELAERSLVVTLPVGIILYGVNINFPLPWNFPAGVIALTFLSALMLGTAVYLFGRALRVREKLTLLLSCGTAICGVSAIAILSPIIKPRKEEFSAAIIIITVVGLTGALLYPFLGYVTGMGSKTYALFSGATLHQTGLVVIASKPFGAEVLMEGLAVKGIRIAMIALVTLLISFIYAEHRFYIPWYVVIFLLVAFLTSFVLPPGMVELLRPLSTIAFSITLASIGFSVNIRDIQNIRLTPLIAAYLGWFSAVGVVLLLVTGWAG
ncbi:MAG: YeiH family putative sulfate export transporter [Euryarchaeota archaeon]|nr:YeiH family putative sulfate export transporter [Euryarchaeota archaeon]